MSGNPEGVRAAAVVLAGGSGSRLGAVLDGAPVNKVFLPLAGRSVLAWSFLHARQVAGMSAFVLVTRPEDEVRARRVVAEELDGLAVEVVHGGATRHASEQAALDHLAPRVRAGEVDVVAVHDGARPLAAPQLWRDVVLAAARHGGALPAVPAEGVVTLGGAGRAVADPGPAGRLVRVQTPQAFRAPELLAAYDRARAAGAEGTDTASTLEAWSDVRVRTVPGSVQNLKVTWPQDVLLAERLVAAHAG